MYAALPHSEYYGLSDFLTIISAAFLYTLTDTFLLKRTVRISHVHKVALTACQVRGFRKCQHTLLSNVNVDVAFRHKETVSQLLRYHFRNSIT